MTTTTNPKERIPHRAVGEEIFENALFPPEVSLLIARILFGTGGVGCSGSLQWARRGGVRISVYQYKQREPCGRLSDEFDLRIRQIPTSERTSLHLDVGIVHDSRRRERICKKVRSNRVDIDVILIKIVILKIWARELLLLIGW